MISVLMIRKLFNDVFVILVFLRANIRSGSLVWSGQISGRSINSNIPINITFSVDNVSSCSTHMSNNTF